METERDGMWRIELTLDPNSGIVWYNAAGRNIHIGFVVNPSDMHDKQERIDNAIDIITARHPEIGHDYVVVASYKQ